ncbi:hypothetical protein BV898_04874 [Hypsibius exemplaris]|uniref:Uncharacterized protein n=1 Tax=Hypsibius exemplaris TaxID=2072580 RepID=A0A1W0X0X8_HYPEX|nr:hypothetical protein BV898_04874 [Hypsibius exemplaris]
MNEDLFDIGSDSSINGLLEELMQPNSSGPLGNFTDMFLQHMSVEGDVGPLLSDISAHNPGHGNSHERYQQPQQQQQQQQQQHHHHSHHIHNHHNHHIQHNQHHHSNTLTSPYSNISSPEVSRSESHLDDVMDGQHNHLHGHPAAAAAAVVECQRCRCRRSSSVDASAGPRRPIPRTRDAATDMGGLQYPPVNLRNSVVSAPVIPRTCRELEDNIRRLITQLQVGMPSASHNDRSIAMACITSFANTAHRFLEDHTPRPRIRVPQTPMYMVEFEM